MSSKNINARKGDKFPAERLDASDLGKKIRVTTRDGAVVTDTLTQLVAVGGQKRGILVGFEHVGPLRRDSFGEHGGVFALDHTTPVVVVKLAEVVKLAGA